MAPRKRRSGRSRQRPAPTRRVQPARPTLVIDRAAEYLVEYVACYRRSYAQFTAARPDGPGYPNLPISPYLGRALDCFLAHDGAAVLAFGPDSAVPFLATPEMSRSALLVPEDVNWVTIGRRDLPPALQRGELPIPVEWVRARTPNGLDLRIHRFGCSIADLFNALTMGLCNFVSHPLRTYFWFPPTIWRQVGLRSWDGRAERYFAYLELLEHVVPAAWEPRAAAIRAHSDVQRDFAALVARRNVTDATMTFGGLPAVRQAFDQVILALNEAIDGFQNLLDDEPNAVEQRFHDYLEAHPILLDVYAQATSKPHFRYPDGPRTDGKTEVVPDFLLAYPGGDYGLVELERPSHAVLRKTAGGRAETSHAAYQTAEWEQFIDYHASTLQDRFPGLVSARVKCIIVIGRDAERSGSPRSFDDQLDLARRQYHADVMTYDGLLRRARRMATSLEVLVPGLGGVGQAPTGPA